MGGRKISRRTVRGTGWPGDTVASGARILLRQRHCAESSVGIFPGSGAACGKERIILRLGFVERTGSIELGTGRIQV